MQCAKLQAKGMLQSPGKVNTCNGIESNLDRTSAQLVHLVENSSALGRLEVLSGDPAIGDGLVELGSLIRRRNWDELLYQRRMQ